MVNDIESNLTIVEKGVEIITTTFSEIISNTVVAAIIILIGFVIGRIIGKIIQTVLKNISLDEIVKKYIRIKLPLEESIGMIISYFIYIFTIILGLNQMGITTQILNIISAIIIIVIILSLFLGLKDIMPNIISGIIINRKKILKKGDKIKIETIEGIVDNVKLTKTIIITSSGDQIYMPNRNIMKNNLIKIKN